MFLVSFLMYQEIVYVDYYVGELVHDFSINLWKLAGHPINPIAICIALGLGA